MILVAVLLGLGFAARHAKDTWLSPWRYETHKRSAIFVDRNGTETVVHGEINLAYPTGVSRRWAQSAEAIQYSAFVLAPTLLLFFSLQFLTKRPESQDEVDYA